MLNSLECADRLAPAEGFFRESKQLGSLDLESGGELQNARKARIEFASLNAADVVAMQPARLSEPLLREAGGRAQLAHRAPEGDVLRREGVHDPLEGRFLRSKGLHSMNVITMNLDCAGVCAPRTYPEERLMFITLTRRSLTAFALTAATIVALPLAAYAAGSPSIASAPLVQPRIQQFGDNTTCCYMGDGFGFHREFWALQLIRGDRVVINWAFPPTDDRNVAPHAFPPSVTDFNFTPAAERPVTYTGGGSGKGSARFVVSSTGRWSIAFVTSAIADEPTSYSFTAFVRHLARISFAPPKSVSRSESLRVTVSTPDGTPISDSALTLRLEAYGMKRWRSVSTSVAKAGKATLPLRLAPASKGTTVRLRVRADGLDYVPSLSPVRSVRVR